MALGFQAEHVYDFGSVDSVNAFNGNLIVNLPLGLRYPVATGFDFGLTLTYNAKIWDYYTVQPYTNGNFYQEARANLRSNAGVGWRVSLGRLLPPSSSTGYGYTDDSHPWLYESPAGDEHPFADFVYNMDGPCGGGMPNPNATVLFTCDGSHLRMVIINSTTRDVEFPDGRIDEFKYAHSRWLLTTKKDRFGDQAALGWSFDDDGYLIESDISNGNGAVATIHYKHLDDMGDSVDQGQNVDYIEFTASGSTATVTYKFNYTPENVPVGPYDSFTGSNLPTAPSCATTNPCTKSMNLLTSIDLPDTVDPTRNHFNFSYAIDSTAPASDSQGMLTDLQLPTGGHLLYQYQLYSLPPSGACDAIDARNSTPGIRTRTVDGHTWTYVLAKAADADLSGTPEAGQCKDPEGTAYPFNWPYRWTRTSIISPPDDATGKSSRKDQYFSSFGMDPAGTLETRLYADDKPGCNCTTSLHLIGYPGVVGWPGATAAKALVPTETDCPAGDCDARIDDGQQTNTLLNLTSQVYDNCTSDGDCTNGTLLRSTWTRNTSPKASPLSTTSEREVFEDDPTCGTNGTSACYRQTDSTEDDNVGHLRQSVVSTVPQQALETRRTEYPGWTNDQARNASIPWALEQFTEKSRMIGAAVDKTQYCFSAAGQLLRTRKLAGTDRAAHDVITDFTYSGADVTDVKSYGGDYQSVGTGELCSLTFSPLQPEYWNHYTYSNGVLAAERYYLRDGTPMSFYTVNRTIEAKTGLVTESKASDGLATTYGYEAWGAINTVSPPGEAATSYTYAPPSGSANATVTATTADADTTYSTVTYTYDGMGRLSKTQRALPGVTCAEQIIGYDSNGRRATESTWKTCNGAGGTTTTRYDGLNRVVSVTTPDTKASSVSYVGTRQVSRTVSIAERDDEKSVTQVETYDPLGRLTGVSVPGSAPLLVGSYDYDIGDRLHSVSVTAPKIGVPQSRAFHYDNRGFLLSESHPELGSTGDGSVAYQHLKENNDPDQGYDSRGHSHYKSTGSAFTLFTSFDSAERLLTVTDGNSVVLKQLTYDSTDATQCPGTTCSGKLSTAIRTNPVLGTVQTTQSYRYDATTGRPVRRDTALSTTTSFSGLSFFFTQAYNKLGAVKKLTYPCQSSDGACTDTPLTIGYNYTDALLSSVDDGNAPVATTWASGITYQPNGLIADVVHGNGKMHEKWSADFAGMARPGNIVARNAADTADLWSTGTYQYDGAGNIKSIGNTAYVYDDLQQLRTTVNAIGSSFNATTTNYDAFGNILSTTQSFCGSGIRCGSSTSLARKTDTSHNHYTDMTYDSAGNVTVDGHRSFAYDALGMTTSVSVSGRTFDYLYDADDERIAIVEPKGGNNRTTWTIRGFDKQLLRSYVDDKWSGTRTIKRKEDEIWRGGQLLASDSLDRGVRYYVLDHLGSPRYLVKSDGTPIGTQTFSPWGMGGSTDGGLLQFTGHERDSASVAELGQSPDASPADLPDDFHARMYDPALGRFLSPDPRWGNPRSPESWNRYVYVANSPINRTDPTGQSWDDFKKFVSQVGQSAATYFGLALPADGTVRAEYVDRVRRLYGTPGERNALRDALRNEARASSSLGARAIATEMDKRPAGGLTPNRTNTGVNAGMDAAEKGGKVMFIVAVAVTATNIAMAPDSERGRVAMREAGAWTGAVVGGEFGGGVGAGLGAALGAPEGGGPAIPGALVGAVGGAFVGAGVGGNVGAQVAGDLYDRIANHTWD
jgi:RHS repeat-associated protein